MQKKKKKLKSCLRTNIHFFKTWITATQRDSMPLTCWDILKRRLLSVLCCVHVPMKPGSALAGLVLNCMELSPSPPPPLAPLLLLLLLLLALAVDSRALSRSRSLRTTPPLTSNSVSSDCQQRRGGRGVDKGAGEKST